MNNQSATPRFVRQLVIVAGAMLLASIVISGVNAYVTLAAPVKSPYVSDKVGFEGQLADSNGNPVTDGNYSVTFSLYSQASGGSALWSEAQTVAVTKGLYSVQLGSVTSLPSNAFDGSRWLGVKVGSDSEMTPRISISAVPFALNAKQAMGLQGFDVASDTPSSNDGLFWDSANSAWTPRGATFPDLGAVGNDASPQALLASYRSGAVVTWDPANSTVSVSPGQVMIDGYMRSNSSAINVGFTAGGLNLGLDTGTAVADTQYYIYAIADDTSASTFQVIVSASASAPYGKSHYRNIGWFKTAETTSTVLPESAGSSVENDYPFVPAVRAYRTTSLSLSSCNTDYYLTFDGERFDTDKMHNTSTNSERLTVQRPGTYLIFTTMTFTGGSQYWKMKIRLNGTTVIGYGEAHAIGGEVSTIYQLAANDYVEAAASCAANSGNAVTVTSNYSPEFGMVWLGP